MNKYRTEFCIVDKNGLAIIQNQIVSADSDGRFWRIEEGGPKIIKKTSIMKVNNKEVSLKNSIYTIKAVIYKKQSLLRTRTFCSVFLVEHGFNDTDVHLIDDIDIPLINNGCTVESSTYQYELSLDSNYDNTSTVCTILLELPGIDKKICLFLKEVKNKLPVIYELPNEFGSCDDSESLEDLKQKNKSSKVKKNKNKKISSKKNSKK